MTEHPCAGRSKRSREVFEQIAIGISDGHPKVTLAKLLRDGLVSVAGFRSLGRDAFSEIVTPVYAVPVLHHMQWCHWCAEQPEDDDTSEAINTDPRTPSP